MVTELMVLLPIAVICMAVMFILYTYAGYDRLLGVLADRAEPVSVSSAKPHSPLSVSFLIVAHNEQSRLAAKIENCLAQDYPTDKLTVVVVSDGSTDLTEEVVRQFEHDSVRLLVRSSRQGKASAINYAMPYIGDDIVVLADVRQRLSLNSVSRLVAHFANNQVGAVTGRLLFESIDTGAEKDQTGFGKGVGRYWAGETRIRQREAAIHSVVGATGALYALRRSAFVRIPDETILDDVLIPMLSVLSGYRVSFEPDAIAYDVPSNDVHRERQRKVRTLAGNFQLMWLCPQLLNPRKNPIFWQFLSHKVCRLFVPLAMLCIFVASVALIVWHWVFTLLVAAQIGACLLAFAPNRFLNRLNSGPFYLLRTFILLHWFVVLGFFEFITNRRAHLWEVRSVERRH